MYVEQNKELQSVNSEHLLTMDRKHKGTYMIEKGVEKRTYNYDRKDNSETINKVAQFIFKIINTFQ